VTCVTGFVLREVRVVDLGHGARFGREPVDVVVSDGSIAGVGRGGDLPAELSTYDAAGRWLIPGLWDQHVHLGQWSMTASRVDLAPARSVEDALALVTQRLRERPGAPVVGWGHRSATWPRQPSVPALDLVTGDRIVVLVSGDGHHAWLSTAALDALGLPRRDDVVAEAEWFAVAPRINDLAEQDASEAIAESLTAAAARGVVGVVDLEFGMAPAAWAVRRPSRLRVRASTYPDTLEDYLAAGLRTGDPVPGAPLVTMGPLKIISDGSLNTRTAWCCTPYVDGGGSGAPNLSEPDLGELVALAHRHGLEVATHAIGDAAVRQALAVYARTGARGSIEHAQLTTAEDIAEMARLGLRASVQPAHLLDDRDLTERSWPDRSDRCFMFRTMLEAGVELALGSDAPVSPLDPWLAMAAAVHRSADERPPWHPEQALTPREALAASVDGRSVSPGAPADLALLDADPLAGSSPVASSGVEPGVPNPAATAHQAAQLRGMQVAATWVAGTLVHDTR
jgi:predicted amidohydrolase YtcJ